MIKWEVAYNYSCKKKLRKSQHRDSDFVVLLVFSTRLHMICMYNTYWTRDLELTKLTLYQLSYIGKSLMPDEGFEPSPPKRLDLKSSALDHSANRARIAWIRYYLLDIIIFNYFCCTEVIYSMWGSNPRPWAHKTHALPTELNEFTKL